MRDRVAALFALAFLASAPGDITAQLGTSDLTPTPHTTLLIWADDVWLTLTDRDGSYFGRVADEGTLQRFNPLMDQEYELDLLTGLFTGNEDARWAEIPSGLRVASASINHPFVLNAIDWRGEVPISGSVSLPARYHRQRSLTAQRDYVNLGVEWRDVLGSSWSLTSSLGAHFFKSSADVTLTLARQWNDDRGGSVRLDLSVAVLDAFNNLIFNTLGVEPEETPAHFSYSTLPLATRIQVVRSSRALHLELHGGLTTRSEVEVSFPAAGDPSYALREQVAFLGGLVQLSLARRMSLAAFGTVAHAATDRRFTPTAPEDLELREDTSVLGWRVAFAATASLGLELDLVATWRPESRRTGGAALSRSNDRQLFGQFGLVRRPPTGWTWRLAYAVLDRRSDVLPQLTATNHRQVMDGGYRFESGFEVIAGLRWDLDRLGSTFFDGGQLRFVAQW